MIYIMNKEDIVVVGTFIKNKTKFACFDNGSSIKVQIVNDLDSFDFTKFKKSIVGKIITIGTNLKDVVYDYNVTLVIWLNKREFEVHYDFRIKRFVDKICHSITFSSEEVDVFAQNRSFLDVVYESLQTKQLDFNNQNISTSFIIDKHKYTLAVYTSLMPPIDMTHNVSFSSFLTISSNEEIHTEEIITLFKLVKNVFAFLSCRGNINIKEAHLDESFTNDEVYRRPYGELYFSRGSKFHEFKGYSNNPMVKSNSIGKYMNNIFNGIVEKTIVCDYIPNDTDSLSSVFINTTSWFQSFFRTFASGHDEYFIEGMNVKIFKNNKKVRVSFGEMIDTLWIDSKEYTSQAIEENLYNSIFLNYDEYKRNFSRRIVKIRNDFCHGYVDFANSDYKYFILDLTNLQILLYGSIFKFIGVNQSDCCRALRQLFLNLDIDL